MNLRDLKILLIEDDAIEVMKMKRTISRFDQDHELIEAENGEEALDLLKQTIIPDIILLDLNMPKMSGIDFLKKMKSDNRFKYIPTIILTTSSNERDLQACYELGIAGYVLKPLKYDEYVLKIHRLLDYWSANELYSL
ncbi:MAG: response regulator [Nonlabens sp.]